jgi:hypothetical protein
VVNRALVDPDRNNFAPRLGLTYAPTAGSVFRGGYGIFYNPAGNEGSSLRLFRNIPYGLTVTQTPGDINVGNRVSEGFLPLPQVDLTSVPNPIGSVFAVAPDFRPSSAQQFNLTLEHEIVPWALSIRAAAVGNLGRHLYNTWNANQPIPGPAALNTRRPLYSSLPNVTDVSYFASDGLSNYYAGQLTVDKRFSKGLSALLGYTWSHAIDNVVLEFGGGAAGPQPQDPRNLRAERGNSIVDLRHRLTASYLWELPFGAGRALMNRGGVLNWILGGWQTNGILTVQTGQPFSPVLQTSTTNGTGSRQDVVGYVTYPKTLQRWFDPSAFASPAPYTYGNAGRNILYGPGRTNWDASLFKNFVIREEVRFEFRAEAFNVLNHPQFGLPNQNIGNAQVGSITSIVGNPRQLQLGLRFQF